MTTARAPRGKPRLPWRISTRAAKYILRGELVEPGDWHLAGVIPTTIPWPTTAQKVTFRGQGVWILPVMRDRQPCIAIIRPRDLNIADAERLFCNLASSIAWVERGGLIIDGVRRASRCTPMGGVRHQPLF
jgi:hypothetical protein